MLQPTRLGMFTRAFAVLTVAYTAGAGAAELGDALPRCTDVSGPRDAVIKQDGGRWIELTDLQHAFAEGVYVLNPNTPAGLPFGDKAALAQVEGDKGGVIFFLDGDRACSPMFVPNELIEMLEQIGQGDVNHEGTLN